MIRFACNSDIDTIVEMWARFHEETLFKTMIDFDMASTKETTKVMMNDPKRFIAMLWENTSGVAGMILGQMFQASWNSHELLGSEICWFVKKEFRGRPIGMDLLDAFEKEVKRRGATHVIMAHMGYDNSKAMSRLYNKKGYSILETHFIKEI